MDLLYLLLYVNLILNLKILLHILFAYLCSFQLFSQFQLNGSAVYLGSDTYRLTQALNSQFGGIWYKIQHDLNTDLVVQGQMNFGSNAAGADGIAFVMQQNCLTAGTSGGGLGFSGIAGQSFAVEFDTYQNIVGTGVENNNDPAFDHIAVEKNGDVIHNANANDITAPIQMHSTLANVKNGNWYDFVISYTASNNNLQVIFDGVVRVNITYDIQGDAFGGDTYAYWGFTSTTGGFNNEQQVMIDADSSSFTINDVALCPGSVPFTLPSLSTLAGTNLAIGNPVTASSGSAASIAAVADGNMGTRWESIWGVDPQWIYIDLQVPVDITSVVLVWEGAYATAYQLQTSNDAVTWTTQFSTTTNTGGTNTINFTASDVRYVRMYGTARSLAPYGYSIWEFQVYGTPNYVWGPDDGTIDDIYGESVVITPTATQTYSVMIPDPCVGFTSYDFVVTVDCVVLPSELVSFYGEHYKDGGLLKWITASEINSDYFRLMKSLDGFNFKPIAEVDAAGNSTQELDYMYYDSERIVGTVYYKLIGVDQDGSEKSSDIITLTSDSNENSSTIFFENETILHMENQELQSYSIYDFFGKLVEFTKVEDNTTEIKIGKNLSPGNYFILLNQTDKIETRRICKAK